MKAHSIITTAVMFAGMLLVPAHEAHTHAKKIAGPHGGRIFASVEPHVEFFVRPDRKIQITVLDDKNKPALVSAFSATATGGKRETPTKFVFTKEGEALVSDMALPEGKSMPIIVRLQPTPAAKTVTERFTVNLADCPECSLKEYACTCAHDH